MNRLTRNTITLLTGNVGSAVLSLLLSILIGRVLGEAGIGAYGVVMAWVLPLRLLAEFGLGTLITREVAADLPLAPDILRTTTAARLILGGGLMLLLWLSAPLLSRDPAVVIGLRVSAPLILIEPFFGAFTAIFRAERVMWPIPLLNLGMLLTQVVLTALVLLRGATVIGVLLVNIGTSVGQLGAAYLIYRLCFLQEPGARSPDIRSLLRRAWPFALAAVLATAQVRVGLIVLEQLAGVGESGFYAAAGRFVEAGRLLPMAFFNALLPALASLAKQPAALDRLFRRAAWGLVILGVILSVGFLFAAEPLVTLTYGSAFIPAAPVLQVLMWSLLPALLRGGRTVYWYARGQEAFVNGVLLGLVLVQVLVLEYLVPVYGGVGAALALLLAEAISLPVMWWGPPGIKRATRRPPGCAERGMDQCSPR